MALTKQAKILSNTQIEAVLRFFEGGRNGLRNRIVFLLSLHGLRVKEIADLEISMVVDGEGRLSDCISLTNKASKGRSGRCVPMSRDLKELLVQYLGEKPDPTRRFVIESERSEKFSANALAVFFKRLYKDLGFVGASSHSGRRTFITNCARQVSKLGGSLRDVMDLAGHVNLATTQRYIERDPVLDRKLIDSIFK